MSGHTPGPWKLSQSHASQVDFIEIVGGEADICVIATMPPVADFGGYAAENAANARLIASAPALLEALRAIAIPFIFTRDAEVLLGTVRDLQRQARTAIALAEGRAA